MLKLFCLLSVLLCGAVSQAQTEDTRPTVEHLHRRWREWTDSLEHCSPRRIVYEYTDPTLRSFGYSNETVTSYVIGGRYFSRERDAKPIPDQKQKGVRYYCHLFTPEYFSIVVRNSPAHKWSISTATAPREEGDFGDPFRKLMIIPGDIPRTSKSLDELYRHSVLDEDKENVTVEFRVRSPKKERDERGVGVIDRFAVTFSKASGWLPTRVDRHFAEGGFWFSTRYETWEDLGGISVPRLVTEGAGKNSAAPPFLVFRILELSIVTEDEVVERCSMSFYDLPQLDFRERRRSPWFMVLLAGTGIAIMAFVAFRRRVESRKNHNMPT